MPEGTQGAAVERYVVGIHADRFEEDSGNIRLSSQLLVGSSDERGRRLQWEPAGFTRKLVGKFPLPARLSIRDDTKSFLCLPRNTNGGCHG